MSLQEFLPCEKDTFNERSSHVAILNSLPKGFLRNYLTQKFLETHEQLPIMQMGMFQEDMGEVSFYKVGV